MMEALRLAQAYLEAGAYGPAKPKTEEALSLARQLRDPDAIRYCRDALGQALLGLKQYEPAREHFLRAALIARKRGDVVGEFSALSGLGETHGLQLDHESALQNFQKALEAAKTSNDAEIIERAMVNVATAQAMLERHKEAADSFRIAADIALRRGDRNKHASYLHLISRSATASGNDEEALEISRRILEMARHAGNRPEEASALTNIGIHHRNLGDHEHALESLQTALGIADSLAPARFDSFGDSDGAAKRVMELRTNIFLNMGGVYTDLSDYDHSLECSLEALRSAEDSGNKDLTMRALRGVGISYGRRDDDARAIEYHEQALQLAEELGSLSYREWCLGILGVAHRKLGQFEKSIDYLERALPLARQLGNSYAKVCLFDLGESYYLKADYESAHKCLTESMGLTESVRGGMETERSRISLAESHTRLAELTVLTCLRLGSDSEAFEYAERGKSRALIDLLGNARINPRTTADQNLLQEAERLREQIEQLRRRLLESSAEADGNGDRASDERLVRLLREGEQREQDAWQKIYRSNPEFVSLRQVEPLRLAEVQEMLEPGQALLEFFATNENLVCFVATTASFDAVKLPLTRAELAGLVVTEVTRENRGLFGAALSGLYQSLINPLIELLRTNKVTHLIFAPHAMLHLLPFGALFDASEGERRYLLDEFAISYTPSASVLWFALNKPYVASESILAIDNPDGSLEFAGAEIAGIKELYPDTVVLSGQSATRSALLGRAKGFGIAHFACHGYFRGDAPEQSGLLLADGSLTMLDIINQLELDAWLVTLSACQTAKARPAGGDEVVGLPRALLYAGAPAVIASLWNVNDQATSILFQHFYANLKAGESPIKALREAQIATREHEQNNKRPFRDPYYWAAFILIGAGGGPSD
jgi:CHAT domain-containing protein/Tfp pilus assembly protein PilF